MDSKTKESIQQLQLMEQSVQNLSVQKQQFQSQLIEVESALEEIDNSEESYKIVGTVMIKKDKESLKEELSHKKSAFELRIKTLEDQEKKVKDKASLLRTDVMKKLE